MQKPGWKTSEFWLSLAAVLEEQLHALRANQKRMLQRVEPGAPCYAGGIVDEP